MTEVLPAEADGIEPLTRAVLTGGVTLVGLDGGTGVAGAAGLAGVALVGAELGALGCVDGAVGVDAARSDELSGGGTGGTVVPDGF